MKPLILLFLCAIASVHAAPTLEWDSNTETNLSGYKVYVGKSSRGYTTNFVTTNTFFVFTNLAASVPGGGNTPVGATYFFAVTAFDTDGLESEYSDEVFLTLTNRPLKVKNVRFSARLAVQSAPAVNGPWSQEPELGEVDLTPQSRFFRLALLPIAPASLFRPLRLEPTSGSKTGKLPLMIPARPRQLPPFPPG